MHQIFFSWLHCVWWEEEEEEECLVQTAVSNRNGWRMYRNIRGSMDTHLALLLEQEDQKRNAHAQDHHYLPWHEQREHRKRSDARVCVCAHKVFSLLFFFITSSLRLAWVIRGKCSVPSPPLSPSLSVFLLPCSSFSVCLCDCQSLTTVDDE